MIERQAYIRRIEELFKALGEEDPQVFERQDLPDELCHFVRASGAFTFEVGEVDEVVKKRLILMYEQMSELCQKKLSKLRGQ